MAGVAGLNSSSKINGCDEKSIQIDPAKAAGNPRHCRTFPQIPCGWTYFVQRTDGLIKIGFSVRPDHRVRGLARAFGKLEPLAIVPSSVAGEYETHQRFDDIRADGEWFYPTHELLAFIDRAKVKFGEAPPLAPAPKRKPAQPTLIERIHALRRKHGAKSPAGYRCSNLAELVPAYQAEADPARRACIAASIQRQMTDLQRLDAAVQ